MIAIRLIWNRQTFPLNIPIREIYVDPEPDWPFGRKGHVLKRVWDELPNQEGMLILDGDVAIDPDDMAVMKQAIARKNNEVFTAPAKIWPASTGFPMRCWAHGHDMYGGDSEEPITRFSFNFTYLPARLMRSAIAGGLGLWTYPDVDRKMSVLAADKGIPVNLVEDCWPKHLNF